MYTEEELLRLKEANQDHSVIQKLCEGFLECKTILRSVRKIVSDSPQYIGSGLERDVEGAGR